jgi:hypothetical protein
MVRPPCYLTLHRITIIIIIIIIINGSVVTNCVISPLQPEQPGLHPTHCLAARTRLPTQLDTAPLRAAPCRLPELLPPHPPMRLPYLLSS